MVGRADNEERWDRGGRDLAYAELDHPADILLEVYGDDLPALLENALFALYDQVAELEGFRLTNRRHLRVHGEDPPEVLRALLSEALYLFESEGFVAAAGSVETEEQPDGWIEARADLSGEKLDRERHRVFAEVKAVTYHKLSAERLPDGRWRATVLLDV